MALKMKFYAFFLTMIDCYSKTAYAFTLSDLDTAPPPNPFSPNKEKRLQDALISRDGDEKFGRNFEFENWRQNSNFRLSRRRDDIIGVDDGPRRKLALLQLENAADWPTPPPIGGVDEPSGRLVSAARKVGATTNFVSLPPTTLEVKRATDVRAKLKSRFSGEGFSSRPPSEHEDIGFVLPPPLPTSFDVPQKDVATSLNDHFDKSDPTLDFRKPSPSPDQAGVFISRLTKQDRFAKLYERFNRFKRDRWASGPAIGQSTPLNEPKIMLPRDSQLNPKMADLLAPQLDRDRLASGLPIGWGTPLNEPKIMLPRDSPINQLAAQSNPNLASNPHFNPNQPLNVPKQPLNTNSVNQQPLLFNPPPNPNGAQLATPVAPPSFASTFPNTSGKVVLARKSVLPDVGEQKIPLTRHLQDPSNLVMGQWTPLNEQKIMLPRDLQANQQAADLMRSGQP